eukprot:scaffold31191_cov41-Attheya_sp.AAC.3
MVGLGYGWDILTCWFVPVFGSDSIWMELELELEPDRWVVRLRFCRARRVVRCNKRVVLGGGSMDVVVVVVVVVDGIVDVDTTTRSDGGIIEGGGGSKEEDSACSNSRDAYGSSTRLPFVP